MLVSQGEILTQTRRGGVGVKCGVDGSGSFVLGSTCCNQTSSTLATGSIHVGRILISREASATTPRVQQEDLNSL